MYLLSIITPVYNNVQFIEQCILNVISQKTHSVEHLIIDGASTDGTIELIKEYASKHAHITWVSEKDKGQSDAMNKGLKLAKGNYISFLNVDDFYSKNTLSKVLSIFQENPLFDFLVGNCSVWDEKGELIYINRPSKVKQWHVLSGYYFSVNPSAYFYKKNIHDVVGEYNIDNHFNMDLEFLIKVSQNFEINYFPLGWGNFRLLPNTKTVLDSAEGTLENRKKQLLKSYVKKATIPVKTYTFLVGQNEKLKRKFHKLKRLIRLPFTMIYWKIKKHLNN